MRTGAGLSRQADTLAAVAEATARALASSGGAAADLAVLLATPHHHERLGAAAAAVHREVGPTVLVGGVAAGVVGPATEVEDGPGLVVWLADAPGEVRPLRTSSVRTPEGGAAVMGWPDTEPGDVTVLLADPLSFPIGQVVARLADERPGQPIVGGLLTGDPTSTRFVVDDRVHDDGAVGAVLHGTGVTTVVSQGCRPVGEPLVVTRAEANVLLELGGVRAVERVERLFTDADQRDRDLLRRGLHIGIVTDEYRERYDRGDFVIRGVLGADRDTGGVAVGDHVEVGRTVQFHVRDAETAHHDLLGHLGTVEKPAGALLFTCNGRGRRFFGVADHDATTVGDELGGPVAGAFCAGEIGPVGGRTHVHGFTASMVVFPVVGPPGLM